MSNANIEGIQLNEKDNELKQFVVFSLADRLYGLEISIVQVIERLKNITRVPKTPKSVVGVFNLRGEIIPVISLRSKFDFDEKEFDDKTRIIIARIDESLVGMIVDEVKEVISLDMNTVEKVDSTSLADVESHHLVGVGKLDDDIITLLKVKSIVEEAFDSKSKK